MSPHNLIAGNFNYRLLNSYGTVAAPFLTTIVTGLGSEVYSGSSVACKVLVQDAPLFVTIEGAISGMTGGDGTTAIYGRCAMMPSATAPSATTFMETLPGKSRFASNDGEGAYLVLLGAAPANQGVYASFMLGLGIAMPIPAPFVGFKFSNPGTAYTAGTLTIYTVCIWG